VETPSGAYLTPNPVEESTPIYGGVLQYGIHLTRSFDAHQLVGYGPAGTLPTFNQLVMFDINYKETVIENIVGDLAESWETSEDGMEITFKLRQGVKWHDGVPFTANDVVYSLDKMTDVDRSAITEWFPAYESAEKIDDYTVKVHLERPSAGFMLALAQGESQIQSLHLAGTDDTSADFMVGTGPYILEEFLVRVHVKWQRNPDYFKTDQYGNQLPYLDGLIFYQLGGSGTNDMLVGRRLDIRSPVTGAATIDTYEYLSEGAPELLWQRREKDIGTAIFINTKHPPLDDVRVRRAMGLLLVQEDLIIGYAGDLMFGIPGQGILPASFGLPKEEIAKLMGWDKPLAERIAEAQQLMAEAGYPEGFKLNMVSLGALTRTQGSSSLVFAEALHKYLKIDAEVHTGLGGTETYKRLDEDNYDTFTGSVRVAQDPAYLNTYFGTGSYSNYSNYANPEMDKMLAEVDYIIDPDERREAIWAIERLLLTDLPALPTGCFIANIMPYYPHVKNIRWTDMAYSNVNRFEDVWIDESLRVK
jgi:peptide/nickel transport system substrate-binding protein